MSVLSKDDQLILSDGACSAVFSKETGRLLSVSKGDTVFFCDGLLFDLGVDETMMNELFVHDPLDDKRTWELPVIQPTPLQSDPGFMSWSCSRNKATARYEKSGFHIALTWQWIHQALSLSLTIHNLCEKTTDVTGVVLALRLPIPKSCQIVESEFPGNVPHDLFDVRKLDPDEIIQAGLVNAVSHHRFDDQNINVIFIDEEEKWGTAIYRTADDVLTTVYYPAVEIRLAPGQGFTVGSLYLQPVGPDQPWLSVRHLFDQLGYTVSGEGIKDGVLYSCHPYGTMDSGFCDPKTMRRYAEELPGLSKLGIDHIWLLPIFEHADRGVYHPSDQAVIDPKYGGDEEVRYFIEEAHKLSLTVLFDYVPHGPAPEDPLAKVHDDWCSRRRDQSLQNEWDCVSFDMTNPHYLDYHFDLVVDHIKRFDVDGSRIDCAMGGLSNWRPYPGSRPSSSNLRGGVQISKTIRDAFLFMNKKPLILPENFNPLPQYYAVSDLFYDMPLYRTLFEMEERQLEPALYAKTLTRWLEREHWITPQNHIKLRFLGNHDTVSWVFFKARAVRVYGAEKAKALWTLLSLIDGIPMIYQGDEDPRLCHQEDLIDLRDFFSELFAVRKQYLDHTFSIRYVYTGTPIFAFVREKGDKQRLVLINLSDSPVEIEKEILTVDFTRLGRIAYGSAEEKGDFIRLPGWGSVLMMDGGRP